ncbi:protein hinderin [Lissotriton helveticus]
MADAAAVSAALYWSRDFSDEEQPMVFVPGVSREGNLRPGSKFISRPTEEVNRKMPTSSTHRDLLRSGGEREQQAVHKSEGVRSASLKDLCLEDKRRIANLIKELARVSEEKEVTEERLKAEQESFEKKIRQMEEQNDLIIQEREALQQQYRECQELLGLYQKYLTEQQEKLNLSISKLGAQDSKQQGSRQKSPLQSLHLEFDGSYLGLAETRNAYQTSKTFNAGSVGLFSDSLHHCQNDPGTRLMLHSTLQEHPGDYPMENGFQKTVNSSPSRNHQGQHQSKFTSSNGHQGQDHQITCLQQAMAHCCVRSPLTSAEHVQRSCQSVHLPTKHHGALSGSRGFSQHPDTTLLNGAPEPQPREKGHGKQSHDQRKQLLLLQKMELEIEKERLQQMLAQQEARLLLKQQQLQQSRLDYNRFKHQNAMETEVMIPDEAFAKQGRHMSVMNGTCSGQSPLNSVGEEYLSRTPTSSKAQHTRKDSSTGRKKSVGFSRHQDLAELTMYLKGTGRPQNGFRRDAATSPTLVGNTKDLVTTATSPLQPNISRYDASLLNLVDDMTPIPTQRHQPLYQQVFDWTMESVTPRSQHKPARRPLALGPQQGRSQGDEELEESRILEDIFFI